MTSQKPEGIYSYFFCVCAPFVKMADDKSASALAKNQQAESEELAPWVRKTLSYLWCFRDIYMENCDRGKWCSFAHAPNKATRTNAARALAEKKRHKYGVCIKGAKCNKNGKCPYAHPYDKAQAAAWSENRSIGPVIGGMKTKWCWANLGGRECPLDPRECGRVHPKRPIEWKRMYDQYHNVLCVTKYGEFLLEPQSSDDSEFEDFNDEYSE